MHHLEGGICGTTLTKRVPQNEGELWNLFPLLTQLKKSCLSGALVQQVGNKGHGAPIVLGYVLVTSFLSMHSCQGSRIVVVRKAAVVLLLRSRCCSCSCSRLLSVLVMGWLLVHPRTAVAWSAELEVAIVRTRHHFGIGGACQTRTGAVGALAGQGRWRDVTEDSQAGANWPVRGHGIAAVEAESNRIG